MKILYHHRIRSKDGQYVHIEELTTALKKAGQELIMVGPTAVEQEEFGADAGAVALLKRFLPKFIYELLEFSYALLDYRRLVRAIRAHRPDVIYERYNLYLPSGVWAARRFGMPLLLEVNAPLYDERKRYDGIALDRLARWTERYVWRGADVVLPVTRVLAARVEQEDVPASRIRVIPNGINPSRFRGDSGGSGVRERLGLKECFVLGFVGFMRDWHGLERIVDFIADTGDGRLHLLLVGDGPARSGIEARARERGVADRLTITGIVGRERVAEYISAFDIALQPDVVAYASPLKLFEYLALGCAIVAPATANLREVLEDGVNAVLFDPENERGLAEAVARLYGDAGLRRRVARGARETISQKGYTWENNAQRVIRLCNRLLAPDGLGAADRA